MKSISLNNYWFIVFHEEGFYFRLAGYGLKFTRETNHYIPFSVRMGLRRGDFNLFGNVWVGLLYRSQLRYWK